MKLLWAKMGKSLLEVVFTEALIQLQSVVLKQAEGISSPVSCLIASSKRSFVS